MSLSTDSNAPVPFLSPSLLRARSLGSCCLVGLESEHMQTLGRPGGPLHPPQGGPLWGLGWARLRQHPWPAQHWTCTWPEWASQSLGFSLDTSLLSCCILSLGECLLQLGHRAVCWRACLILELSLWGYFIPLILIYKFWAPLGLLL